MAHYQLVPILPVPDTVFFPHTVMPLHIVEPNYVKMIQRAEKEGRHIGIALAEPVEEDQQLKFQRYSPKRIFGAGRPIIIEKTEEGTLKVIIEGKSRMKMVAVHQELPYLIYEAEAYDDEEENGFLPLQYKIERLMNILNEWLAENVENSVEREEIAENFQSLRHIVDYASFFLIQDASMRQLLLENVSLRERIELLNSLLRNPHHHLGEDTLVAEAIKEYETIEKTAKIGH